MTELPDRVLDWRKSTDPRNRRFRIDAIIPRKLRVPRSWMAPTLRIDQGREGACVGFGWTNELMMSPDRVRVPGVAKPTAADANRWAHDMWVEAKQRDEWPGENYDWSSLNGGAKACRDRGYVDAWYWADDVDQIIDVIVADQSEGGGPVVLGIPWLVSMYWPRPSGLLEVDGEVAGGHCIVARGYHPARRLRGESGTYETVTLLNSWGPGYGLNGSAYIKVADLARLLADGEAAVPVGRHIKPRV